MGYECLLALDKKYGDELKNATLILGNGSSISCSPNFNYRYLYEKAAFNEEERLIFKKFETENFEYILRKLFQASEVNKILNLDSDQIVARKYETIRIKLIETIKEIHPARGELELSVIHDKIFDSLMQYKYIIDLNYDFILYWILSAQNKCPFPSENHEHEKKYKGSPFDHFYDGFHYDENRNLSFDYDNIDNLRDSNANRKTGIFYPHGNLLFVRARNNGETLKIKSSGNLIDAVDESWTNGNTPLFVSEGTKGQKMSSIRSDSYLNYVYNEVLGHLTEFIVVYGWSMSECDDHLVHKIFHNERVKKVAVSIHPDGMDSTVLDDEKFRISQKIKKENNNLDVEFWEC